MTYVDVRDAVVNEMKETFIKAKNGLGIEIKAHSGGFSEQELKRVFQKTPAILTSLLEMGSDDSTDNSYCSFVTWVVYRADNRDLLADGALKLVSAIMVFLQNFDLPYLYSVGKIKAEDVYSASLDDTNVSLWAISWRCELQGIISSSEGENIEGVFPELEGLECFDGWDSSLKIDNQANAVIDNVNLEVKNGDSNEADS